ncbi:uracil/xanthine transporter [Calidifontibacillus erzurumensis]|uniref:Uracil/xanthine transporter n=1 Tax=Calidifontibacillus erzurumensis TaxID=2741433 RepID=A0A8J8GE93_9BACI|nr:uracil/xanthine transporter [Calidifontibacillus erzurumensis]NSL52249.1 uracil/xanthine transporter [Calidifontibacillus erzurumensis]
MKNNGGKISIDWKLSFASIQWLFFIFANTVVVPVSIGTAFHLSPDVIASMLRSSLIFTGLACMLQGYFGHRYPLMEGHSGVIWGLILHLCISAQTLGLSYSEIGGGIATGLLLAGVVAILFVKLNLIHLLHRIFTPMVMSVYLFLLTFQLILIFFKGMFKVNEDGTIDIPVALLSIGIVVIVSLLIIKGNEVIANFSILIGMVVGWVIYAIFFQSESFNGEPSFILIFPLGWPNLNIGIVTVTFLAGLINLSNTIASIQAAANLFHERPTERQFKRSYLLTGFYSIGAAFLGLVSYTPFASSIGFLESTRIFDRKPFIISGGLMVLLGVFPFLGSFLSTMPMTVGNAVLFVAYLQLLGTSLKSLNGYVFNSKTIYRLAAPLLIGVSIMNMDSSLFNSIPIILRPIISNGFIMGVIIAILTEKMIKWDNIKEAA